MGNSSAVCCDNSHTQVSESVAVSESDGPKTYKDAKFYKDEESGQLVQEDLSGAAKRALKRSPEAARAAATNGTKAIDATTAATNAAVEQLLDEGRLIIVFTERGAFSSKDVIVVFEHRPLGLGYGPSPAPGCCGAHHATARVTSVDQTKELLKDVRIGMHFKSINGTDVQDMEWTDLKALLKEDIEELPQAKV